MSGGGVAVNKNFGPYHSSTLPFDGETLYIGDDGRFVRRMREGVTATLAGSIERGFADGAPARFEGPLGLHADGEAVMVADFGNHRIRRVERGVTTTVAGTGARGGDDGAALEATFDQPAGIERLSDGAWIIVERPRSETMRVRRLYDDAVLTVCEIGPSTPPGPTLPSPGMFMGRRIAQTMHYAGAPWLVRDSREREEDTSTFLEQLDVQEGAVVCDIGCGNGFYALPIATKVGPEGRVIGLDIQPRMLDFLRTRAMEAGIDNVVPHLGTITDPRLEPDSVDLMIAVDVYHEFSHPEQMMAHLHEALRDDGRFVLLEFRAEDRAVPIKPLHKMSKAQMVQEMEAHGFVVDATFDDLPWQHMVTFRKR
ncbi:MAG: methyltransferase domain-containing protein [Phycisphaerales bacterium]|nr:methyltransferase domain-containing protein [Phycisphaerales bacterium]